MKGLTGTIYPSTDPAYDVQVDTWIVPYKFYRMTRVRMWKQGEEMSGFEVTFEPPATYTGWAPYTKMFGSTLLASEWNYEDFDEIFSIKLLKDLGHDIGIIGFCADEDPIGGKYSKCLNAK